MESGQPRFTAIELGTFLLDGGSMFGVVPKVVWETRLTPDSRNRIPMQTRVLLVETEDRKILCDTGMGMKMDERMQSLYGTSGLRDIEMALLETGIHPDAITDVVYTHLHFDHAGGGTCLRDGKPVPTFKNARYHAQRAHWEHARNPNARDRASFLEENLTPIEEAGQLVLHDGPGPLFDGVEVLVTDGHTTAQQHPLFRGKQPVFYPADIFPTSHHLPARWNMAFDNSPLSVFEEKSRILEAAIKENWTVVFEHDPDVATARIEMDGKRPLAIPVPLP